MKLGFFSFPAGCGNFYKGLDETKKFGFKYIEPSVFIPDFAKSLDDETLFENAKKAKAAMDETGVKPSCFSVGADLAGSQREKCIAELKKYAKVCQVMGVPYLHHTLYASLTPGISDEKFTELLPEIISAAQEVYDYAKFLGVKCVYEDQGFLVNGCKRFQEFVNGMQRDIGVVADLGNIYFVDERPIDFVKKFLPYIVHVHIKDYIFKPGSAPAPGKHWYKTTKGNYLRETMVGHGDIDFEEIFETLIRVDYNGTFSLECTSLELENYQNTALNIENLLRFWENAKKNVKAEKID